MPKYNDGDIIIPVPYGNTIIYYDQITDTWFNSDPRLYYNPVDAVINTSNISLIILSFLILFIITK